MRIAFRQASSCSLAQGIVGFGLFKALMEQSYSTAMSTRPNVHVIINDVPFSVMASFSIILCAAVLLAFGARLRPRVIRPVACSAIVVLSCAILVALPGNKLPALVPVLSLVYGVTAIIGNTAWLDALARLGTQPCVLSLIAGSLLGATLSLALTALPLSVAPFLAAGTGLFSAGLYLCTTSGSPRPSSVTETERPPSVGSVLRRLAAPLAVYACLSIALGLIASFQAVGAPPSQGAFAKGIASVVAYALLLVIALRARTVPDISALFKVAVPAVALLLGILPFLGPTYMLLFDAIFVALNAIASTVALALLLGMCVERRVPVIPSVAVVTLGSRALLLVGLLLGSALGSLGFADLTTRTLAVAFVALYLLSLGLVALTRRQRPDPESPVKAAATGAGRLEASPKTSSEPAALHSASGARNDGGTPPHAAFDGHRLTPRERELAQLMVRGMTISQAADKLGLAVSTVRGYTKGLYAKLGVHSREELVALYGGSELPKHAD